MGRGRQKAKQTKVARELKYHSSDIDVTALQRELGSAPVLTPVQRSEDDDDDQYSRYASYYNDDDDEGDGGLTAARR